MTTRERRSTGGQELSGLPGVGGLRLLQRRWPEAAPPARGSVVIVHGLAEHGGRYEHVATHLNRAGFSVWALDHRGHGGSEGRRGHVERFAQYVADLETLRLHAQAALPGRAPVALGHSLGGLIAASHAASHPGAWAGLALSAPALGPPPASAALVLAAKVLSRAAPRLGVHTLDSATVSRDPAVVAAYERDPLVHRGALSARLGVEVLRAVAALRRDAAAVTAPALLLQGEADRLVEPIRARVVFDSFGSSDKTVRCYPGLYHEVFNEPEREAVLGDLVDWLTVRFPPL
ncbi:MAG: lysophospholipase [Acidimicrobiales bacterium]